MHLKLYRQERVIRFAVTLRHMTAGPTPAKHFWPDAGLWSLSAVDNLVCILTVNQGVEADGRTDAEGSWQWTLHGVLWVGQEVAVEGPAEGEEVQGLAALLLGRGADGAAGLEDAPLGAALGQKHPTHQPPQGLEAGQLHQYLDGGRGLFKSWTVH